MNSQQLTLHNFLHAADSAWVLPWAAGIGLVLLLQRQWRGALAWALALSAAMSVIVAGKIAFDLFGWSLPALQFYNISGHAMFAAALYPTLGGLLASGGSFRTWCVGTLLGTLLALAIAAVLVWRLDHTLSETVLGAAVGFLASAATLAQKPRLRWPTKALLACLPLLGFLAWQHVYHPVHHVRHGVWQQVAQWFEVDQRYTRRIVRDPHTGRVQVRVGRAGLRWS